MKGFAELVKLRRAGQRPKAVWITVDQPEPLAGVWRQWHSWAHVGVEPHESIATLDLRALVGLPVMVCGEDERRVRAMHDACRAAGAKRVFMHLDAINRFGVSECVLQVVDGVTTWQAVPA